MTNQYRWAAALTAAAVSIVVLQASGAGVASAASWKRIGSSSTASTSTLSMAKRKPLPIPTASATSSPAPTTTTTTTPTTSTSPAATVAEPTAAPAPATGTRWGLHQDLTWDGLASRRAIAEDVATRLGGSVSRNSLLWSQVERTPGQRDWSRVDAVVAELRARGIAPLLVPVGSPSWANGVDASVVDAQYYVPASDDAFDLWARQFAQFAGAAAERYKGQVPYWEVWNEENQPFFWKPTPDPERYAKLYAYTSAAIAAADPAAVTAFGGIVGITAGPTWAPVRVGGWDGHGGGMEFLRRSLAAGAAPAAVALHPYSKGDPALLYQWDNSFSDIGKVHDYLASTGRSAVALWVTEWGWNGAYLSDATISQYITTSVKMIRSTFPYVRLATYFKDVDTAQYQWGLADSVGNLKGAAAAWTAAIA